MQQSSLPILEQQKAWKAINPAGALELDLATLHARASTYLPNVTKADLRKAIGPGPFALDQLQELFSKRPQQEADFQTQYARFLSTRAAKLTPAEAAAQQLEDWQDIGKMTKEDREAVHKYLASVGTAPPTVP